MRFFPATLLFLSAIAAALAVTPYDYKFSADENGQHIDVALELRPFDRKTHRLKKRGSDVLIDGRVPIGTGPGSDSALTEFSRFEVHWNRKRVHVPLSLYADIFNASLLPKANPVFNKDGSVWTSVSNDGQSILIEFEGGEAGGAYKVWMIIRRNGDHQRFIDYTAP